MSSLDDLCSLEPDISPTSHLRLIDAQPRKPRRVAARKAIRGELPDCISHGCSCQDSGAVGHTQRRVEPAGEMRERGLRDVEKEANEVGQVVGVVDDLVYIIRLHSYRWQEPCDHYQTPHDSTAEHTCEECPVSGQNQYYQVQCTRHEAIDTSLYYYSRDDESNGTSTLSHSVSHSGCVTFKKRSTGSICHMTESWTFRAR